jgi:hypothetical protein
MVVSAAAEAAIEKLEYILSACQKERPWGLMGEANYISETPSLEQLLNQGFVAVSTASMAVPLI